MTGDDFETPLLAGSSSDQPEEDSTHTRTGTIWTAVAHVITAVIGSGVLSLAWCMAQLGWIAGPLTMLCFALVTIVSSSLLSDCYRSPDPEHGPIRHRSYRHAVRMYLGRRSAWMCGCFVNVSLYGFGVAYTITSAISMRAIQKSNCYHDEGHEAACSYSDTSYILLFGIIQVVMSQIPNFHNIEGLSIVAAIMSFTYASIGFALGLAKTIGDGKIKGNISGVAATSSLAKVWLVAQAFGDIAFAYPYSTVLLDIQDTLKSPPPENQSMKKASTIAVCITTFFYLCCGGFGYAAFGDDTPGNLLTGFGFYEPYWLIDFANACIVFHLVGGYQVYSQPLFATIDRWFSKKFPESEFVNNEYTFKLAQLPSFRFNLSRLCVRTVYVATQTVLAMIFPYFNEVIGVIGGFIFWPLAIYFPVEMYLVQKDIRAWTRNWIAFQIFSTLCLFITIFSVTGSIQGLVSATLS